MPLPLLSYQNEVARTRAAVSDQLSRLWLGLGSYRDADVDRFLRIALPKVQAGQSRVARLTAARLGGPVLPREQVTGLRQVPQRVEYRRPAVALYTALSNGAALPTAVSAGANLLSSLVSTDLQMVLVAQAQASLQSQRVSHYRRVLTGSENCDLCRIASTNLYSTADLLPIHDRCDCTVEPVYEPAEFVSPDVGLGSLALTSQRQADVQAGASPESLVAVEQHGEVGPMLVWASDHFTGPDEIHIVTDGLHK